MAHFEPKIKIKFLGGAPFHGALDLTSSALPRSQYPKYASERSGRNPAKAPRRRPVGIEPCVPGRCQQLDTVSCTALCIYYKLQTKRGGLVVGRLVTSLAERRALITQT